MNFVDKVLKKTMQKLGTSTRAETLEMLNIATGTYDSWKNRNTIPIKRLRDISEKTGILIAELMSENDTISITSSQNFSNNQNGKKLIDMFIALDTKDQERLYSEIKMLYKQKTSLDIISE